MTRPDWIDETLYPFESRYLDVAGCTVHYVDEGSGPTILFVHGNPTWSFLYRDIIDLLRPRFRCIAIDHPGFGLSKAPPGYAFTPAEHADVLERFILDLDLDRLTVMGQDWGGPIGLGAAARHPDRVAAIVVANTWAWPANSSPFFQLFSRFVGGAIGKILIERYNAFVELSMPMGTARVRVAPEVIEHYRRPFAERDSRVPTWVFPREILRSRDYLRAVERSLPLLRDRPALILWGTRDVAFRRAARRGFERAFPNHQTVLMHGVGHYIQKDAPTEVADAISVWHPRSPRRAAAPARRAAGHSPGPQPRPAQSARVGVRPPDSWPGDLQAFPRAAPRRGG